MKHLSWIFVLLLSLIIPEVNAQKCATDDIHKSLMLSDSNYARNYNRMKTRWSQAATVANNGLVINTANGPIYEIPVVVHVMHAGDALGSTNNPTDATINTYITYLNSVFAAQWSFYVDTNNGGVNIPIRFALAKRTPVCGGGTTTGINRINVSTTYPNYTSNGINRSSFSGVPDATLKAMSLWPTTEYYNIWMVNYIDGPSGGVGGYAYYPGGPVNQDGTVILTRYATPYSNGTYYYAVPHELGHAFGLIHTFEGDNNGTSCPSNFSCTSEGDEVCDTEPHINLNNGVCASGINPCTGTGYQGVQYNIMNYTACPNRFTAGQRSRALFNLLNYRSGLLSSLGTTPPAAFTPPATACIPGNTATGNNYDIGPREISLANLTPNSYGYSGDNYQAYINKTCTQQAAQLTAGQPYTLSVNTSINEQTVRAWIDYNNDGVFQATELVLSNVGTLTEETHSNTFTVPTTGIVTCTPLRLRIMADYAGSTLPQSCNNLEYGQTEDYSVFVSPPSTTPTVSIAASATSICAGASVTFTATATGTSPVYQWRVNGNPVGTNASTYSSTTLANGNLVTCTITTTTGCVGTTTNTTSNTITMAVSTATPPTISIVANPTGAICSGTPVTFTPTITNGGTAPAYQWKVNGVNVGTGTTYTSATLANTNQVTCVLTSNATCASPLTATSNIVTMSVNASVTPSVAISASATNICQGTNVIFTATPVNGGTSPVYQWKVNGTNVGTNSATFASTTFTNGNIVTCVMNSSAACPAPTQVTSNAVTLAVSSSVTPSVSITSNATNICLGTSVIFTATPVNGGTSPSYQWKVNGTNVGGNSATYTTTSLTNGNIVTCVLTSNAPCTSAATATSNTITMVITTSVTPAVSITVNPGLTICFGTPVTFIATPVNGGTNPSYQWKVNGVNVATGNTYTNNALNNLDQVSCTMTSSVTCALPSNVTASVTMNVSPASIPLISITAVQTFPVCSGAMIDFLANVNLSGPTTVYQWKRNGVNIAGANTTLYSTNSLANADIISCEMTSTNACVSPSVALSNSYSVAITPSGIPVATIATNPGDTVCAGAPVTFSAITATGGTSPVFTWKRNGTTVGNTSATYTETGLSNGDIITLTMISNAVCVTQSNSLPSVKVMTVLPAPAVTVTMAGNALTATTGFVSYQWYYNNAPIAGATSATVTATLDGTYHVVVTDAKGCTAKSANMNYTTVGIKAIGTEDLVVYPNPTHDFVFLKSASPVNIRLYSLEGKLLVSVEQATKLDMRSFADGTYMLEVRNDEHRLLTTQRIVKMQR